MKTADIRTVTTKDALALAELHTESFGDEGWSFEQVKGSLALETTQGWAAFEDDKPLGFILCQMLPEQAEILTFCVTPAKRRQKIGEALAHAAVDAARVKKCQKTFLEVAADNVAAQNLYERLDFKIIGVRRGYYRRDGVRVDAITLALAL